MDDRLTPPWRRRSNLMLLAVCALVASLVAIPIARDPKPVSADDPPTPDKVDDITATWDADVPDEIGEVLYAQLAPRHVLVTGTDGFTVLDAENGEPLWGKDLSPKLTADTAPVITSIVNDVVMVRGRADREHAFADTTIRVLELHSGIQRFAVEADLSHDFTSVATLAALVTEDCAKDGSCTMTGLSWQDGEPKWRHEYHGKATLPSVVPRGVVEGQDQLTDATPQPVAVPATSLAVMSQRDGDRIEFTAIELADGREVREWDDPADSGDPPEYSVLGPVLVEHHESGDSIIDPGTGEARYHLRGRFRYGPHPRQEASQSVVDGEYLLDAYSGTDGDTDAGFGAFGLASLETGEIAFEEVPSAGLLVGGELGTVVTLTGTEADGRPRLHGVDIDTGTQQWSVALHPKGKRMHGFQSESVAMFDNHLAVTGGPSSWTSGDYFGGARTHVVDLADGRIRRIDDVAVQAMGHNAMLGLVNPPRHTEEDDPPRLAYYELQGGVSPE